MLAQFGPVQYNKIRDVNGPSTELSWTLPNWATPHDTTKLAWYCMVIIGIVHQNFIISSLPTKGKVNITVATPVNWTRETFKLISLWNKDIIREQHEECRRNSLVYHKIADDLHKAGYSRFLENVEIRSRS